MTTRTFDEPGLEENIPQQPIRYSDGAPPVAPKQTVLGQLRTELSKPAETVKDITLRVKAHPSVSVKYNTDIDVDQLDKWRERARPNKKKDDINVILMNYFIMQSQCIGIFVNGEQALDERGDAITFISPEFLEMLNSLDVNGAIKALYVRDPDILKVGGDILKAAGYDMDEDEEDPLD
jgi:hypothetical protein